ncbi:Pre-mRNA-splicing factor cwc15 [Scedosporium apiospermum]|uniref:Pre-mRNA-splicing factor cwc15 n=1 Tax=Pseudallescheria apiosperma TaxID=563466 RepID=A0A084G532_PSEDA|nr:Pre-mRNA-splicing factor cwc15 [Scedosporium apiospermum]KEZ42444.1 Pre-mRNA-splicing factor cwc15 [Scedosporium apiospermum]
MTTAHRPTFDPARGREALRGSTYHQITLPAHLQLKYRKAGQGGSASDASKRDLRAELLAAEEAHFAKKNGTTRRAPTSRSPSPSVEGDLKRTREEPDEEEEEEDLEAKRRRILAETRAIDADDSDEESDESEESDSDDDSDAELQRELERVRREKAERRAREEEERQREEEEQKERDIALGNPLLNKPDFSIKRRWDDDVVFKNQARDTDDRGKKKEFVNDMLRSDFHRRFMNKYVR